MRGLLAPSPLLLFVSLYLSASLVARDFYSVPLSVVFLLSSLYALSITRGRLVRRISVFCRGAGSGQMMLMVLIFILAGAFAQTAKDMGCIDATVNLTLASLPQQMLLPGLFLAACIISLSIGTSVGTIAALVPIAAGVGQQTGISVALITAAVVGGSFFGDNLSFISDTTIVATQSQGCKMSDKFRVNAFIVVPAAFCVFLVYLFLGMRGGAVQPDVHAASFVRVLPYVVVLVSAFAGLNVVAVLVTGIALTAVIGFFGHSFTVLSWMQSVGNGISGMGELIIITMMAGGLLQLIKHNGGIDFVITILTRRIASKRGAELAVAAIVSMVNVCTANNTVAIITVGSVARRIGERFALDPRKCASLLDTFSCAVQGLLPYGAQLLIASSLAHVSPIEIVTVQFYPVAIALFAIGAIILRYPRRYS